MKDQIVEIFWQYLWTPLVALFAFLWHESAKNKDAIAAVAVTVGEHETMLESISTAVDEARESRKEIFNKVDSVRIELNQGHTKLRDEQREDFKELRKLIVKIGK